MSRPFEASYPGRCPGCDCPIEPGERVRYVDDDLLHEACADRGPAAILDAAPGKPCGACWTVHAGECL